MRDAAETNRAAIIDRIMKRLAEADDKTLRELERLVGSWLWFRREQKKG